jgi:hypothetical protein
MTVIKSPKKLIEVALPLDDIKVAAAREKSICHGHPFGGRVGFWLQGYPPIFSGWITISQAMGRFPFQKVSNFNVTNPSAVSHGLAKNYQTLKSGGPESARKLGLLLSNFNVR